MRLNHIGRRLRNLFDLSPDENQSEPINRAACEVLEQRRLLTAVAAGQFDVDANPQSFIFDVAGAPASNVTLADAEVYDLTNATERTNNSLTFSYDPATTIAELSFSDPTTGSTIPPNANYEALLNFENILDGNGNPIGTSDAVVETFFVQGDLDRDRDVDLFDAARLERNFGRSGPDVTWSDGDLDGDQDVDLFDAARLERSFGITLHAPPATPGTLSATTQSESEILTTRNLSVEEIKSGNTSTPDEWRIFRSFDGVDYVAHDSIPGTQNSYSDSGLTDGTKYWYRWRPWTAAAGLGHTTNEVSSVTVLPAPTSVTANIVSPDNVQVAWTNNATTQTTFQIERAIGNGPFVQVATAPGTTNSVTFTDVGVDGTYRYRVIAENSVSNSAPSVSASATTSSVVTLWNDPNAALSSGYTLIDSNATTLTIPENKPGATLTNVLVAPPIDTADPYIIDADFGLTDIGSELQFYSNVDGAYLVRAEYSDSTAEEYYVFDDFEVFLQAGQQPTPVRWATIIPPQARLGVELILISDPNGPSYQDDPQQDPQGRKALVLGNTIINNDNPNNVIVEYVQDVASAIARIDFWWRAFGTEISVVMLGHGGSGLMGIGDGWQQDIGGYITNDPSDNLGLFWFDEFTVQNRNKVNEMWFYGCGVAEPPTGQSFLDDAASQMQAITYGYDKDIASSGDGRWWVLQGGALQIGV